MDFRNILFPVDFSESCAAGVSYVKAMARLFDAPVFLLHVLENAGSGPSEARTNATRTLMEMARISFEGLSAVPVIRQGDPAVEIAAFAEGRGVDLIMMPIHGAGRIREALLGSVTAKVLSDSPCPVWTAAHPESKAPRAPGEIRSLLCAIDLSPESRALIRAADSLGARTGAKVRLVHAVDGDETAPRTAMELDFEKYLKYCARVSIARLQQETGTAFDLCLQAGPPSRVVETVARHHEADLVIAGRGKLQAYGGRLNTHAYSLIRDTPCAVLSF